MTLSGSITSVNVLQCVMYHFSKKEEEIGEIRTQEISKLVVFSSSATLNTGTNKGQRVAGRFDTSGGLDQKKVFVIIHQ